MDDEYFFTVHFMNSSVFQQKLPAILICDLIQHDYMAIKGIKVSSELGATPCPSINGGRPKNFAALPHEN